MLRRRRARRLWPLGSSSSGGAAAAAALLALLCAQHCVASAAPPPAAAGRALRQAPTQPSPKIVGGADAAEGRCEQLPAAARGWRAGSPNARSCASLLHPAARSTRAHCKLDSHPLHPHAIKYQIFRFPYQVGLYMWVNGALNRFCGGVLIQPSTVSAAPQPAARVVRRAVVAACRGWQRSPKLVGAQIQPSTVSAICKACTQGGCSAHARSQRTSCSEAAAATQALHAVQSCQKVD